MNRLVLLPLLCVFCISACNSPGKLNSRDNYPNLINYRFTPSDPKAKAVPMSDLGAWHGIALPSGNDSLMGCTGPYLLGEFCWAGSYLTSFSVGTKGKPLAYSSYSANAYPGLLQVDAMAQGLSVTSKTFFVSNRSHINLVSITNSTTNRIEFTAQWQGKLFAPFQLSCVNGRLTAKTHKGLIVISFSSPNSFANSVAADTSYVCTSIEPISLSPNQSMEIAAAVTYMPYNECDRDELLKVDEVLTDGMSVLEKNQCRWDGYISSLVRPEVQGYDYVPVKALQTLITNWKTPTGSLTHQGIVPSMAVSYFYGFWAWDSWKHAVAAVHFEPELAKDQVRTMFSYLDSMGMVADCIFPDPMENNWRDSKPPLAAWAVHEVFKATSDIEFVKELLPKLEKYHQWWYKYRDYNRNGLCEFGSTDGTLEAAMWESGMDNAVRYDDSRMIEFAPFAFSLNHESVDLNAYLYLEKLILAELYRMVGDAYRAEEFNSSASNLKDLINKTFFDDKEGFYFDVNTDTGEHIRIAGPEGWTPLWCGVANQSQADRVAEVMLNPKRFNTFVPLPTLDASHPKFTYDGYWRGPIWLDQVYFGISALRRYGYAKQADELTIRVFDNLGGLNGDLPIFENYDPHTGEPLKAPNFSWSAAHLLMLYSDFYMD